MSRQDPSSLSHPAPLSVELRHEFHATSSRVTRRLCRDSGATQRTWRSLRHRRRRRTFTRNQPAIDRTAGWWPRVFVMLRASVCVRPVALRPTAAICCRRRAASHRRLLATTSFALSRPRRQPFRSGIPRDATGPFLSVSRLQQLQQTPGERQKLV